MNIFVLEKVAGRAKTGFGLLDTIKSWLPSREAGFWAAAFYTALCCWAWRIRRGREEERGEGGGGARSGGEEIVGREE